jgi:hypothetical protein
MGFLGSSVGRKIVMAATGLLLLTFLGIHLVGNSLIYFGQLQRLRGKAPQACRRWYGPPGSAWQRFSRFISSSASGYP